jgi:dCTP deaminase
VVLSDKSISEQLEGGGIVIEPFAEGSIQPSSVDLRVDRYFRVFRNDTTPYIDPKEPQEDLTELVEVDEDGAFILHPGEFVLGSTLERVALGNDLVARLEGKSSLGRAPDAGALQCRQPADRDLSRDEDRADLLPADDDRG